MPTIYFPESDQTDFFILFINSKSRYKTTQINFDLFIFKITYLKNTFYLFTLNKCLIIKHEKLLLFWHKVIKQNNKVYSYDIVQLNNNVIKYHITSELKSLLKMLLIRINYAMHLFIEDNNWKK